MSQKIHLLSDNLCNKIAAGEVVERPASVVKELVENSLDAGAQKVRVEIEGGGKKLIRVVDDGEGMSRDDAFLCLERHATSKLAREEDLFALGTLGFRGEAIPSIASVSRFCLRTRTRESLEGWEIQVDGGTVRKAQAAGVAVGTTMEVRDLFFQTPARRKFLRRNETEQGHIGDVITKLALANPQVQFRLVADGRTLLDLYGNVSREERIAAVLGRAIMKQLLPVSRFEEGLELSGYLSSPELNRSNTAHVYTYINGRYIRDRVFQHAFMEGYRTVLPKGRYPLAVVFLDIDPGMVDVNVHPTKHEVRFLDQKRVHDCISASVREVLRSAPWLRQTPERATEPPSKETTPVDEAPPIPMVMPEPVMSPEPLPIEAVREAVREVLVPYEKVSSPSLPPTVPLSSSPAAQPTCQTQPASGESQGFFSALEVLGQYRKSYLLCQDGDDLILIDQHAAHERVGFENLRRQYRQGGIPGQTLLFPRILELDFKQAAVIQEWLPYLERFGFDVEPFGGNAFALKAIPSLLRERDAEGLLTDLTAELAALGNSSVLEDALDSLLALMACHSVIRANQALSRFEIDALLRQLDEVDFNGNCPHGRPVMKRLRLSEIEHMFKRT